MTAGRLRLGWVCSAAFVLLALAPTAGRAALVIPPGGTTLSALNKAGEPESRAGAHPDRLLLSFKFSETGGEPEYAKELAIDFPPGLSGNVSAVPFCPRERITGPFVSSAACAPDTQIGTLQNGESTPLYNVKPGPNEVASFAAVAGPRALLFSGRLRPADQGLSLYLTDLGHARTDSFGEPAPAFEEGTIELWGVPADHQVGTSIARRPLLSNPSRCDAGPLSAKFTLRTWQHPDLQTTGLADTGHPISDCAGLRFGPGLGFSLDDPRADAATGARIDIDAPLNEDADGRATAEIRDVNILLPEGMTLLPGGAAGLAACTDAQLGLGSSTDPTCPAGSRVGTVEVAIPSLSTPLTGTLFLGEEHPGDRYRLLIAAGGHGAELKFAGSLRPNPQTGQLTTSLSNMPQAAFERITLRFDGGPRALLATPLSCGPAKATASFVPYSGGASVEGTSSTTVAATGGGSCAAPGPFAPTFNGGTTSTKAGHTTAFAATLRRHDGEQLPERLEIVFPPGVSAAVGTLPTCSSGAAGSGICPASSRVGGVVGELGPGANPLRLNGDIYLTGPYRRAPFGLVLAFKGAAGPFNLGTLAVRATLSTDAQTGQVTVATDPLPASFEGIPIRFQTLGLDVDRPGFLSNPTACAPSAVAATMRAASGAIARSSTPFAVHDCIDLPFAPHIGVSLTGRSELHKGGRPGLQIAAKVPAGNANLRKAIISLPGILKFDAAALKAICARADAAANRCPKGSRIGTGVARTPVLSKPLQGKVFAVQPHGGGTPDIWLSLAGSGLNVNLKAETASRKGHVETRLVGLPDFPLRSFALNFAGGKDGVFKLKERPCAKHGLLAPAEVEGQNGSLKNIRTPVAAKAACGRHG
jgi:hypothetical protein